MLFGISICLGLLIAALFKNQSGFDYAVCVSIAIVTAGFFMEIAINKKFKVYQLPLAIGYLLRIILLFYDVYSSDPLNLPLVGGPLASDPLGFYNSAVKVSEGLAINYGGKFSQLIGAIFAFTGPSRLWGEYIVVLFSIGTMLVVARLLDELDICAVTKTMSMMLLCCMPNYLLLSVVFRRETVITFFTAISFVYFIRWARNKGGDRSFLLASIYILLASLFHGGTGLIIVGYITARIYFDPGTSTFRLKTKNILAGIMFVLVFMVVFSKFGSTFFNKLDRLSSGIGEVASERDAGGSSYARYVGDSRTPLRMIIYSLPRLLYFMYSPFPWQWRGIADIITFAMSSFVYLYILVNAIGQLKVMKKEEKSLVIILILIVMLISFVFAWGVTNTGTATRHRDKFLVLYVVIYAISREAKLKSKVRKLI